MNIRHNPPREGLFLGLGRSRDNHFQSNFERFISLKQAHGRLNDVLCSFRSFINILSLYYSSFKELVIVKQGSGQPSSIYIYLNH